MEISFGQDIALEKEPNLLDEFVIGFVSVLNKLKINYVIVSGYVAIVFGRNRTSEDIDILIQKINSSAFFRLWHALKEEFVCLNTSAPNSAFTDYLRSGLVLRFSHKNTFIPNTELKFPKTELDLWTLENRKRLILNSTELFISPLELQIPFKLFLGSEKDIEDAKYLYRLFEHNLDNYLLQAFLKKLKKEDVFRNYIK